MWSKSFYLLVLMLVTACTSSPTGRQQLLLFSESNMNKLGEQSFEQIKRDQTLSKNIAVNNYVTCVANSITKHVPKQAGFSEWEVVVFESDEVNAFALPGGKIGVYTGLLKVAQNQDQLATVIGHEIAHVLAQHSNERLSQTQLANAGLQVTSIALESSEYKEYQKTTMAALGIGVQYGLLLPYGRSQESEADMVGLDLMSKAGYDPHQSVALWQNMSKASQGKQPPELLSTHPSHGTRIGDLSKRITTLAPTNTPRPNCQ